MIRKIAIAGYRSLRDVKLGLGALNVVTGANGSGKSSLYRAVRLLADIAQGRIIQSLAAEGGLHSTLWAGPVQGTVRKASVSLKLGFSGDDYGYAIDLGLPVTPTSSQFSRDPVIKVESQWTGKRLAAPMCSRCATDRASAFAMIPAPGGRSLPSWRHSTA
jgi:predicted ATPase